MNIRQLSYLHYSLKQLVLKPQLFNIESEYQSNVPTLNEMQLNF